MSQSKKRRPCPAVGHDITPADCGENRLSRHSCPETCGFNPFSAANYSALLALEDELDATTVARLRTDAPDPVALANALSSAQRRNPGHGLHAATVWALFFARDGAGRTFGERWAQTGDLTHAN